jgi:Protein of unknown function (DUF3515)
VPRRPHLAIFPVLTLAGCGFGAVDVEPYDVTPGSEAACTSLLDGLPNVITDAVVRDVEPATLPAAAWGRPAVVLRCGVGVPPEYEPGEILSEIDGVAWLPIDGVGGMFFATVDRDPVVEVAIPDAYHPGDVLADLAPAVRTHIPERSLP